MNSNNDSDNRTDGLMDNGDVFDDEAVDLYNMALAYGAGAPSDIPPASLTDDEGMVDIFELAKASAAYSPVTGEIFYFGDNSNSGDNDAFFDDDEDEDFSDDDDDEDFSDDDDDEDFSDDDEDFSDEDDEDEDFSEDDEDEDFSEDDEDEDFFDDDDEEDEDFFDDDDEDEDFSDEDEDFFDHDEDDADEGFSDEDEDFFDHDEDDADEDFSHDDDRDEDENFFDDDEDNIKYVGGEYDDYYDYSKEGDMAGFVDINNFLQPPVQSHVAPAAENDDSYVDLFEMANKAQYLPEMDKHGTMYYWAKRKTASGWVKFAAKCFAVLLLGLVVSGVLYFNGLLSLIDFKAASDFEQYYNLSDTDYRNEEDDETVYSTPVYYNESTTIEGFNESMIDIPKKDVLNILLIGTDVRGGTYEDRGNTDSMILVSLNTRDKNIRLTSFMRDMYVDIPGREWQRLNAAYAYGGPQLLFDTLKKNFDVDVDLYVRVNFANFRKIINHVGGVDIELTEAEANYMNKYADRYKTDPVESGWQHLDGAQALSYARCRKIDSDFNRTKRQRTVILALVKEIKGSSPGELNSLLNVFLPMIQTNMSKMQILSLLADGTRYLNSNIETLNVPIKNSWRSEMIRKKSVLCPNFELNKTAITAHIYSTYHLDVENTKYQNFDIPN